MLACCARADALRSFRARSSTAVAGTALANARHAAVPAAVAAAVTAALAVKREAVNVAADVDTVRLRGGGCAAAARRLRGGCAVVAAAATWLHRGAARRLRASSVWVGGRVRVR